MTLAKNIRYHREKNRYTRKGLATLVNSSPSHLYQIERGTTKDVSVYLVARIAAVFSVSIENLLAEEKS